MRINIATNNNNSSDENNKPVITAEDYSDNPYLYDTRGPKKQINYGNMKGSHFDEAEEQDQVMYEE